jgi:hypothetical protein
MVSSAEVPVMLRVAIPYIFNDEDWLGGRNYFANLIRAIRLVAADRVELTLVTGRRIRTTLPDEFVDLRVLRTSLFDRKSPGWWVRTLDMRLLNRDLLLTTYLKRHRIDVLSHCMHLGPRSGIVTLSWLYDFQFLHLPELWTKGQIKWATQWYQAACRNCDAVLVSSASALNDLNGFAPFGTHIRGILHFVSNPISLEGLPSLEELQKHYAIQDRYFYLPNQFWQNKNHQLVVKALAVLRASARDGVQVVCTGKTLDGRQPHFFDQLMQHVIESGLADHFRVLGIVPLAHAQALMLHSLAVINPSKFEGWSTSVEEAKTMDKPILLSKIAVHLEQNPPLGVFFDPENASQLADLLYQIHNGSPSDLKPSHALPSYEERLQSYGLTYLNLLDQALRASHGS